MRTQPLHQILRPHLSPLSKFRQGHHPDEIDEGRVLETLPKLEFLPVEALFVPFQRHSNTGHIGIPGLHQNAARTLSPAGPARHLRQQLERPLGRSEVRDVQAGVGVGDHHQGDVGEIVPLGYHLSAQ